MFGHNRYSIDRRAFEDEMNVHSPSSRCSTSFLHEGEQIVKKFFAFGFIGQFVELNKRNRSIDFSRRSPAVFSRGKTKRLALEEREERSN